MNIPLDSILAVMLGGDHHKDPAPHNLTPKIELGPSLRKLKRHFMLWHDCASLFDTF
jgi:hypothetical protein